MEAQATVSKPNSRAAARATATTRSLKESVGAQTASFLTQTSRTPSFSASRSARTSGVSPGLDRTGGTAAERQEVGVAPDPVAAGLDLALQRLGVEAGVIVGDLERPEALIAYIEGLERVFGPAFLTSEGRHCHFASPCPISIATKKTSALSAEDPSGTSTHISSGESTCWNWHLPLRTESLGGLPGFRQAASLHPSGCARSMWIAI